MKDSLGLDGRTVIITGAGRGLGLSYALTLAERGAFVVVNDIGKVDGQGESRADLVVHDILDAGGHAIASQHDVATVEGGTSLVSLALESFGAIDAVIHNAGFLRPGFIEDLDGDAIREVIEVHLLGAFNVVRPAWEHLKPRSTDRGRVR